MAKEPEKLKDYTLYQYQLLSRTKLHYTVMLSIFILIVIGLSFLMDHSSLNTILPFILAMIAPYVFTALITVIYCKSQDIEVKMHISFYSLWHGLVIPKSMLGTASFRQYELSVLFLSLMFIAGLYVWLPFTIWASMTYQLSIILAVRLYLMTRTLISHPKSLIRYEQQGIAQYLTDGK